MTILITSLQLASPVGIGVECHLNYLRAGKSALSTIGDQKACLPFEVKQAIGKFCLDHRIESYDRTVQLALYLAAQLDFSVPLEQRGEWGALFGSSRGPQESMEELVRQHSEGGRISAKASPLTTLSHISSAVARYFHLGGISPFISSTCSTLITIIGMASSLIASEVISGAICGASEVVNHSLLPEMLKAAKVMSSCTNDQYPQQPYSLTAKGMILAEGAAVFVVESDRGQPAWAEIKGFAAATEAGTLAGISRLGDAIYQACTRALKMARLEAEQIDFIVGHGAGTLLGDQAELAAYSRIWNPLPPVISHKWMTGHTLGASGGIGLALGLSHLNQGWLPQYPYLTKVTMDNLPTKKRPQNFLIVAMGFGGQASAMILSLPVKNNIL